jgi:hypothetical protein
MTDIDLNTPDSIDIEEKLHDAVDELQKDTESPTQELFAVDGLGNTPNEQRPLRTKAAS